MWTFDMNSVIFCDIHDMRYFKLVWLESDMTTVLTVMIWKFICHVTWLVALATELHSKLKPKRWRAFINIKMGSEELSLQSCDKKYILRGSCKNLSCSMRVFLFAFIVYIQGRTVIGKTRLLETFGAPQAIAKTATIKRSKAFMALPRTSDQLDQLDRTRTIAIP